MIVQISDVDGVLGLDVEPGEEVAIGFGHGAEKCILHKAFGLNPAAALKVSMDTERGEWVIEREIVNSKVFLPHVRIPFTQPLPEGTMAILAPVELADKIDSVVRGEPVGPTPPEVEIDPFSLIEMQAAIRRYREDMEDGIAPKGDCESYCCNGLRRAHREARFYIGLLESAGIPTE